MQPKIFSKMHGLGNDFVVLNCLHLPFSWTKDDISALAHRNCGIGFDQLLLLEPPKSSAADFSYRIFNADGSEVEHCGNGARCLGKYIRDNGLFDFTRPAVVQTQKRTIIIDYCGVQNGSELFRVQMGVPDFSPFTTLQTSALAQPLSLAAGHFECGIVSMGNPHAVICVDDVETAAVTAIGSALQQHPLFPQRVNVGFMQIINREHIRLRVFERGVGETLACGTGACGAVSVGIARGDLAQTVHVDLRGGSLIIDWAGEKEPLFMTGSATAVYHGQIL